MKSFLNPLISGASADQHAVWTPSEELVPYVPKQEKKEQVKAMFLEDLLEKKEQKPRSNIHTVDSNKQFTKWQPGGMDWQPPFVGHDAWVFIETDQDIVLPPPSRDVVVEENVPQPAPVEPPFDPEKEAGAILRRARAEADEIILEAQRAADSSVSQALEEIEQLKQDAIQQGLQQGLNELRQELGTLLGASRLMVDEVQEWKKSLLAQGEQVIVTMVKDIAQTMFSEGVQLDGQALQMNLNRVMESAQGLGDLNIFLNPRDARLLDPSWSEYQLLISGDRIKVIPSENITQGGCFVKGSMGTVDARVETQLAAVLKTFDEN